MTVTSPSFNDFQPNSPGECNSCPYNPPSRTGHHHRPRHFLTTPAKSSKMHFQNRFTDFLLRRLGPCPFCCHDQMLISQFSKCSSNQGSMGSFRVPTTSATKHLLLIVPTATGSPSSKFSLYRTQMFILPPLFFNSCSKL